MTSFTVRSAVESDVTAMGRVYFEAELAALRESNPDGFPDEWFQVGTHEHAADVMKHSFFAAELERWVVEKHSAILGFAVAGPDQSDPLLAELQSMYVLPSSWGSGAGDALMTEVHAWILKASFADAILWTPKNNARSRRFYERWGWIDAGEMRKTPGDMPLVKYRLPEIA